MLYIQLQNLKSKEEEQKIILVLRWKTIPKTINTWLNWNLCQWDLFIDGVKGIKELLLKDYTEGQIAYFKKEGEKFREGIDYCMKFIGVE